MERLKVALEVAAEGGWGGEDGADKKGVLGSGGVYGDEAVRVRCKEALQLWEEVEITGGWEWAQMRVKSADRRKRGAAGLVRRMLKDSKGDDGETKVKMMSMQLDEDELKLK